MRVVLARGQGHASPHRCNFSTGAAEGALAEAPAAPSANFLANSFYFIIIIIFGVFGGNTPLIPPLLSGERRNPRPVLLCTDSSGVLLLGSPRHQRCVVLWPAGAAALGGSGRRRPVFSPQPWGRLAGRRGSP